MTPLRVLLADDHALFRQGIKLLLETRADIQVVGMAADGTEALALTRKTHPDIILMDIEMPGCGGIEATRRIKLEFPQVKIVVLSVVEDCEIILEALKNGAQGYLLKNLESYQLFDMLDGLQRGETPLSGKIATKILTAFNAPQPPASRARASDPECLSRAESQVLELLVTGMSNKEIADTLVVTENTVKSHLASILAKLHLQNRIQAAVYAVRHGLVESVSDLP